MDKGYLLPGELEPEDDLWLVVAVPNQPEYTQAFLGAYSEFAIWRTWEKTGDNKGSIAANRWRRSVLRTLECWPRILSNYLVEDLTCNMAELIDALKDIRDAIKAIEAATEIYSQLDIACCDAFTNLDPVPPPSGVVVGEEGLPEHIVDWNEYQSVLCDLAQWLLDSFIRQLEQMGGLFGIGALSVTAVALLIRAITALTNIVMGATIETSAMIWKSIHDSSGGVIEQIIELVESRRYDLICTITSASTPQQAHDQFHAVMREIVGTVLWSIFWRDSWPLASFESMFGMVDLEGNPIEIPLEQQGRVCLPCEILDICDHKLVPALVTDVSGSIGTAIQDIEIVLPNSVRVQLSSVNDGAHILVAQFDHVPEEAVGFVMRLSKSATLRGVPGPGAHLNQAGDSVIGVSSDFSCASSVPLSECMAEEWGGFALHSFDNDGVKDEIRLHVTPGEGELMYSSLWWLVPDVSSED